MSVGIMVQSVGTARPQMAVAVAHGLGLPVDKTLRAIYRAPSMLVGEIEPALASRLSALLQDTGLETEVVDGDPQISPPDLHDVAVRVADPAALDAALSAVAAFCACDLPRALALLTTPPGIVLGGVSPSTIAALRDNLPGEGVSLTASPTAEARFMAFVQASSPALGAEIEKAIATASGADEEGLGAVDFEAGQRLWARYGRTGALRLVNRDFMTFDLWLDGMLDGAVPDLSILGEVGDVPQEHWQAVVNAAPLILARDLDYDRLQQVLPMCAEAGLQVRGELTTFAHAAVQVSVGDIAAAAPVFDLFGLGRPSRLPCVTPAMALVKARLLIGALGRAGISADLAEDAHG